MQITNTKNKNGKCLIHTMGAHNLNFEDVKFDEIDTDTFKETSQVSGALCLTDPNQIFSFYYTQVQVLQTKFFNSQGLAMIFNLLKLNNPDCAKTPSLFNK